MENLIFSELPISKEVLKALDAMGFEEATPIQSQGIPPLLEGKDVIAQAPTGTGKTCAFGVPVIESIDINDNQVQVLVLCPTRELVIQSCEEFKNVAQFKRGIKIVPIYGGQQIERQIMALKKKPQIIIATPGRLMDHLRRNTIKLDNLKIIVLDEADEMLNMGFREDIDTILKVVPDERQTVLFSATLSKAIMDIANNYQKNDKVLVKVTHKELTVPTIEQYYLEVRGKHKLDVLCRLIDMNHFRLSLVFCNTKMMVDELCSNLAARGYSAEALHGDMKQSQRDKVMSKFRKGTVDILIATDVAARGIDVDDIDAVFNYDIPSDEEYYVHRIGRTGRAKRTGVSYTFAFGKDMYKLRDIMRYTKSKIVPLKVPSTSDVEENRVRNTFKELETKIKAGGLTRYVDYLHRFIEEDDSNEITTLDIAAALLSDVMGNNMDCYIEDKELFAVNSYRDRDSDRDRGRIRSKRDKRDKFDKSTKTSKLGTTRMFINIGSKDNAKARSISDVITTNTQVDGKSIGSIAVYDKFSFIEVPTKSVKDVITSLRGLEYKGRSVVIDIANKKN